MKHKAPDKGIRPTKKEIEKTDAITLKDGEVQAGKLKKHLECNICGKRFINNLALEGHMQIQVDPVDTYVCHICHQDFKQVLSLMEHVYMHDKGGDHTCRHCQKDFTEKNKTRKHIGQIHAKEMFSCNDCPESSTGRDQSSNHMVKHDEAFGPGKANLERASKKLNPQVEGSYKRKETHGVIKLDKESDIKEKEVKHKAPNETTMLAKEEVVESDALTLEDGQFKQLRRRSL